MTWMIKHYPINELRAMSGDFQRLCNSALPRTFGGDEGLLSGNWSPTVDIFEGAEAITLEADLPGLKPGDFDLSVENYQLTLHGERKFARADKGEGYQRIERGYGGFTRIFTLPTTVNVDAVKAEFKDGVLRVTLPKREEVKARQIQVEVKTEAKPQAAV